MLQPQLSPSPSDAPAVDYLKIEAESHQAEQCCTTALDAVNKDHIKCLMTFDNEHLQKEDIHGQTVLHHSVSNNNYQISKYLIEQCVSLKEVISQNGENAALIAAAKADLNIMELLLSGPLRDTIKTAMHRDVNGTSVLMAAVARGQNDVALWLLKRFGKALAMLPNNANMLPLHVAAAQGNVEFIRIATKYDNQMVNFRDEFGCTPCVYAVQGGCLSSAKYLVEKAKSEMGSVSNRGQSLLHIAALCGHAHIVSWILPKTGTEAILWTTKDNANAVHCAAFSGSVPVLHLLLSVFSRKKRRSILSLRDSRGNSPLHLAAINDNIHAAHYLLENGADPQLVNLAGHSAQSIGAARGHRQMATLVAAFNGNKKKSKTAKKSHSYHDLTQMGGYRSSPGVYSSSNYGTTSERALSPRDLSSGYSSNGEAYPESQVSGEVIRRRMRYVEDETDSLRDNAAQTDEDMLKERIKVLDDQTWTGLGLSAVEQIDRILDEVDVYE